jgi:hypothetical protein
MRTLGKPAQAIRKAIESCPVFGCNRLIGWAGVIAMAYVPGFKWDIFLSYPMEVKPWATKLEEHLSQEPLLAAVRDLKIYFAPRNWTAASVSEEMLDAARSSAIFVALLTKDALTAEEERFLEREIDAFGESGSLKGRFCPVPLYPLDAVELSKALPIAGSRSFWNMSIEFFFYDKYVPIMLAADNEPERGLYKRTVGRFAHHLRELLDKLRTNAPRRVGINKGLFSGRTVFLAPTAPKSYLEDERQEIKNLLENDGATVIPNESTKNEAAATLGADLFVQLFSLAVSLDHPKSQVKLLEGRQSIPILQWRKKHEVATIDSAMLAGLDDDGKRFCEHESVQTGLLEDFKLVLRDKLAELSAPPPEALPSGRPYIYITADTADLHWARQLQETARKRTVAFVMSQVKAQRRRDFEKGLRQAAGVIFLYGDAKREFVEGWINELAHKVQQPLLDRTLKVLYRAPPDKTKDDEPLVPFDGLRTEGSYKEFTLQGIEKICAELCGDSAR